MLCKSSVNNRIALVIGWLVFVMKILVCFYKNKLACLPHMRASYVVYANAHCRINSLYHFSLYENVCLSYKTSLLPCNHLQIWGGGD
jgi:hypothetical protein